MYTSGRDQYFPHYSTSQLQSGHMCVCENYMQNDFAVRISEPSTTENEFCFSSKLIETQGWMWKCKAFI